jgi:Ser/Thr protein kinase RdoA (MazF antagonist)
VGTSSKGREIGIIVSFEIGQVIEQIRKTYGLANPVCKNLMTPANDAIEVTSPTGHFALKLYNPASKIAPEVQWEIDLTLHLIRNGAPVAHPVAGSNGDRLQIFMLDGQARVAVLFEWAKGAKPKADESTYRLLGQSAARIHRAADTFTSTLPREEYTTATLLDEQLERMRQPLVESGQWQRVFELTERLRKIITRPTLDYGVCHMDLTLDNVHRHDNSLTVFDLDSAGQCWRAYEPSSVLKLSEGYFRAWLGGYRSIRRFGQDDENAVAAFRIISGMRGAVWELGLARSSRGEPLLQTGDLPGVVEEWLDWELNMVAE